MKLLIGIPAYNEATVIANVLKSLPKKLRGIDIIDILVVDDGSQDNTYEIARAQGVKVLRHLINRGLGGALKTIFEYAKRNDYDILVTFDADGQHNASDIPRIIRLILDKHFELVIGSRWTGLNNRPFMRFLVNKFANFLTYLIFNVKTSDSQSGLRAFNKNAIKKIVLQSDGMEVSSEFFREIYRNNLKYAEIPINAIYTNYSLRKGQKVQNAPNVFFQLFLRLLR